MLSRYGQSLCFASGKLMAWSSIGQRQAGMLMPGLLSNLQQTASMAGKRQRKPLPLPKPFPKLPAVKKSIQWTGDEDKKVKKGVTEYGPDWVRIAATYLPRRTPDMIQLRWTQVINPAGAKKKPWTPQEDAELIKAVGKLGANWNEISVIIPGRSGRQCRIRWKEELSVRVNLWTAEEDAIIRQLSKKKVPWREMGPHLKDRGKNAIRSRCIELGIIKKVRVEEKSNKEEKEQ